MLAECRAARFARDQNYLATLVERIGKEVDLGAFA